MSAASIHEFEARKKLQDVGKVILVGSGKGGVGKSFVASGLALALSARKFRTGILDLDIHGSSLPSYLHVKSPLKSGEEGIIPKLAGKLKVMSVALFTGDNPVPMRGDKKQELIAQLFSLTDWEKLDYLVIDLPPGTGDEILTAFRLFGTKCSLILVTTPAPNALNIVGRLQRLAESEQIPIDGIIVNMSYASYGKKKIELFGKFNPLVFEAKLGSPIIGEIPFEPRVSFSSLKTLLTEIGAVANSFQSIVDKITK